MKLKGVAFDFECRARQTARTVALFPGAWNPPTTAHLAIAEAALSSCDEVVWVLPREMPHKTFHGASFDARVEMLCRIAEVEDRFSVATSTAGLYIDIAKDARQTLGAGVEIHLLCGRDAADRIATWDYGRKGVFEEILESFPLIVAAREGHFHVAERHRERIVPLTMEPGFKNVSSSEVRARIGAGHDWRSLVPAVLHGDIARHYS